MPRRSLPKRIAWTLRDYAKRVWDNAGEDNIFFLAGGVSFNLLLAAVPFVLLLFSALGYILDQTAADATSRVWMFIERLLPPHAERADSPLHKLINEIIATRGTVGLFGAIAFVWFSTRLFGSLRTVLAEIFDIEQERGIVQGKIFDIKITVLASLLFAANTVLSAYLALATTRGVSALSRFGLAPDVMGTLEFYVGWLLAFAVLVLMFFSLYKFLPVRRIRWQAALLAAAFTSTMFELAKYGFTAFLESFNPGSLYTGTLYVIVIMVTWVYYAAVIFILGGEVGQVYELRRVRRLQRETFED
ncbi:MAG TPA: YihY/virulence factor BrkB family protein [Gemmatimonadaceae bacterium]|jgi:membrane protein